MRADARRLPIPDASLDLVVAFDVLEHIEDDAIAVGEICRTLRRGGIALVAVPADPRLWSAHDDAVGHVRRYTRETLRTLVESSELHIESLDSWNVLLRPVAAWRRRHATGSDLDEMNPVLNMGLRAVVAAERDLPVKSLPGVSLVATARRT